MSVFKSILLVDDDETTNFLHTKLLKRLNISDGLVVVMNGKEALDYLELQSIKDQSYPDLIFLDIKMPVMDGFEFLEIYEDKQRLGPQNIPVIMLTTSVNPTDTERLKQHKSIRKYFTKPLTEKIVAEIIQDFTSA